MLCDLYRGRQQRCDINSVYPRPAEADIGVLRYSLLIKLRYPVSGFNRYGTGRAMMTPYDTGETKDIQKDQASEVAADTRRPSRSEAEAAVELLLRWIGDDPAREGLIGTPERVVRAWEEFCVGYNEDPASMLQRTFEEVEGYDDMVMLRNIRIESHCEHHLVPILGSAHIAYVPNRRLMEEKKLARY